MLQSEYRQAALCIVVLYADTRDAGMRSRDRAPPTPCCRLGTPGFGLVPNGVSAVTVTYRAAPPRTIAVHRNFFVIVAPSQTAPPCGVQWLDPTGNVSKIAVGCSYLKVERHELERVPRLRRGQAGDRCERRSRRWRRRSARATSRRRGPPG